jgi:dihydroorotate dehydrogenase electron transfer subunit
MGFRTAAEVCGIADLQANGVAVGIHTEDGTMGIRGRVDLDLANRLTHVDRVLTCGPWRMMATVARLARAAGVPCEAALEREMGCGIGACLGCVVEATDGQYLRVCVEGPVVSAEQVAWEA